MRRAASPARATPAGWMERQCCQLDGKAVYGPLEGIPVQRLEGSGARPTERKRRTVACRGSTIDEICFLPAALNSTATRPRAFCANPGRFSYGSRGYSLCMRLRFDSFLCRSMETKKKNIQYGHDLVSHKASPNRNIFVHMNKIIDFLSKIIRKFVLQVNKKDGITSSTANLVSMRR